MTAYKSQTEASIKSLRQETNQNKEEIRNKLGELEFEIRSVASSVDECNSALRADREAYQSGIQKLNSEIEVLRARANSNMASQAASAVCTSPQTSTMVRVIDTGQLAGQLSTAGSEVGNHTSPSINSVNVGIESACDSVSNTNAIAASCIEHVSAQPEKSVDIRQYSELS
jgi:chromosome segregation ATPase